MGTDLEMYGVSAFDVFDGQFLLVAQMLGRLNFDTTSVLYFLPLIHILNVMISN